AHEEVLLFLTLLAFGDVLNCPAEAYGQALRPGTLKVSKSVSLHPTDLTISPPDPELAGGVLRIGRIERRLAIRPKPFVVVRMHALHEVSDRYLISGQVKIFLKARISRANVAERIVPPPPESGCIESELQAVFARLQVMFRRLSPDGGFVKLRHKRV